MSVLKGEKSSTGNVRNHNGLYAYIPRVRYYLSSFSLKNNPAEKMMENYIAHPSVSVSVWSKEVT